MFKIVHYESRNDAFTGFTFDSEYQAFLCLLGKLTVLYPETKDFTELLQEYEIEAIV